MFSVLPNCITIDCGKDNAALSTLTSAKKGPKKKKIHPIGARKEVRSWHLLILLYY
jgi:hypothetical protein